MQPFSDPEAVPKHSWSPEDTSDVFRALCIQRAAVPDVQGPRCKGGRVSPAALGNHVHVALHPGGTPPVRQPRTMTLSELGFSQP